jgi:hypothetical protein
MGQYGELADQGSNVARGAGPLCADGAAVGRDGHHRDGPQLPFPRECQVLLQNLNNRGCCLISWGLRSFREGLSVVR